MSKVQEILDILQEECAEIIVEVSKIRRFGIDSEYKDGGTQRDNLVKEIGDVMAMVDLLKEHDVITDGEITDAKRNKFLKLRKWSTIYE